jgi:beta-glucanase (GH16 family)
MMKKLRPLFLMLLCLPIFLVSSCKKEDKPDNSNEPSNLQITVTLPEGTGTVIFEAVAENATEYRFYAATGVEPIINSSGKFEYLYVNPGTYRIEVRAYGVSGRYIKKEKQFTLAEDGEITVEQGYSTPMEYTGYQRVWNDEFDGESVNSANWKFETGAGGWGNNEKQYYRPDNTSVDGGLLTIEARKESYQNSEYTSSRMVTQGKKSFTYGRVDIRALLPKGQGIWPALWMLGNSFTTTGWPACGEIDIMEMVGGNGREKTVHGTLHWDNNGLVSYGQSYSLNSGTFADEYHVFTLIWDETSMKWYVNDVKFNEVDITPAHMSEFHLPQFFIFNIAVGGNWPGLPDATTIFPQQMKVDYIRVFQKD